MLSLKSASTSNAPLAVNGKGRVVNLNADQVDGASASALQNKVFRYRLPTSSGATSYTWNLPGLPSGRYLATYSVYSQTDAIVGQCWLQKSPGSKVKLLANAANAFSSATWNASGVVTTTEVAQLTCVGDAAFTVDTTTDGPTEVTFTRLDSIVPGTAVIAP